MSRLIRVICNDILNSQGEKTKEMKVCALLLYDCALYWLRIQDISFLDIENYLKTVNSLSVP